MRRMIAAAGLGVDLLASRSAATEKLGRSVGEFQAYILRRRDANAATAN